MRVTITIEIEGPREKHSRIMRRENVQTIGAWKGPGDPFIAWAAVKSRDMMEEMMNLSDIREDIAQCLAFEERTDGS